MGTSARVEGREVLVGNRRLMAERGVDAAALEADAERLAAGLMGLADVVRPSSKDTVAELHRLGVEAAMITGDNWGVARAVAGEVGIETVLAEVLPEHKTSEVA